MSKINVCLIGTGRAGMIHGRNFVSSVPDARLIALCDPSTSSLNSANDELSVPYLYNDYQEALSNPEIDAVVVVVFCKGNVQKIAIKKYISLPAEFYSIISR